MLIESGKLRQRVTVQRRDVTQNEFGEQATTWATVATLWAEVVDRSGSQIFKAEQQINETHTRVRIRYRADITPAMRVVYRGVNYDVAAVLDLTGDRNFLELTCVRGKNDG